MTSNLRPERSSRQQDHQETQNQPDQGYHVMSQTPGILKLINFYTGVILCLGGVGVFLVTVTSRKWVELDVEVGVATNTASHRRTLSHMGPWLACNYGHHCDKPWILAPGLDERSVRGVQTMLLLVILTYLSGAAIIILQLLRPKGLLELKACKCLLDHAIAEGLIPVGAVLAFIFILMMGELKRKLILQPRETANPGWAFVVCLVSVLSTIVGSLCMIFNRQRSGCVKASSGTTIGQQQQVQPSNEMLKKRDRVKKSLVTRPAPQHSDTGVAGASQNIGLAEGSIYQISEAEVRPREDNNMAHLEEKFRANILPRNILDNREGSATLHESREVVFVDTEQCDHKCTTSYDHHDTFSDVREMEHSIEQHVDTAGTNLSTLGEGGRRGSLTNTNHEIFTSTTGQVGRPRPRPLDKPRLLETQSDWLTFYASEPPCSEFFKQADLTVTQIVPHHKDFSEATDTLKNQAQKNHQVQNIDLSFQTGQVTL